MYSMAWLSRSSTWISFLCCFTLEGAPAAPPDLVCPIRSGGWAAAFTQPSHAVLLPCQTDSTGRGTALHAWLSPARRAEQSCGKAQNGPGRRHRLRALPQ